MRPYTGPLDGSGEGAVEKRTRGLKNRQEKSSLSKDTKVGNRMAPSGNGKSGSRER